MPGLLGSLFVGQGGLNTSGIGISVIGDNIANSNTTGFKTARAHFEDLLSEFIVGAAGANQLGRGVTLQRIEKSFSQGSFQSTGVPTDLAISGNGMFVLSGLALGKSQNVYTRNGAFRFDDEGFLVNQAGYRVQGHNSSEAGEVSSIVEDVKIAPGRLLQPNATDEVIINANFRPDDPIFAFDVNNPEDTATFRTSVVAFDGLGNPHEITVYGSRTAANEWDMNAVVDGADIAGGAAGVPTLIPLGTLLFDQQGQLLDEQINNPINIPWAGTVPGDVTFEFGDAINDGGTGREGTTQWNETSESVAHYQSQNGYGTGELDGISIDDRGQIIGAFTNGRQQILGQVILAKFADPTGLAMVGGNNFVATAASGEAIVGEARGGGRGAIVASTLELSTTELSGQFIDLITYQRAFQANSRTIQTADGLLQEIFQILR
ncbi:MAG: flagellar hook protein FlgE [Myxococcota bacterium]|nr:flagellar hook protein FlgE [Myxococcota bacterium]